MTNVELDFLDRKIESVLKLYGEGVPLKDMWENEDTTRLMEAFREVYWMLKDLNQ